MNMAALSSTFLLGVVAPHPANADTFSAQNIQGIMIVFPGNPNHIAEGGYLMTGSISTSPQEILLRLKYLNVTCSGTYKIRLNRTDPTIPLTCSDGERGIATETHDPCDKTNDFDGGNIEFPDKTIGSFTFGSPLYLYGCNIIVGK
jgi:hypothetical protein